MAYYIKPTVATLGSVGYYIKPTVATLGSVGYYIKPAVATLGSVAYYGKHDGEYRDNLFHFLCCFAPSFGGGWGRPIFGTASPPLCSVR